MNNTTYSKGKKNASNSKIKIYNESLSRGKNIIYIGKKKKRPTLSYQLKTINRYTIDWSKEKNTVIAAKLQVQKSAQY